MNLKELHEKIGEFYMSEALQPAVCRDKYGNYHTVKSIEEKSIKYYYNKSDELSKCYTAIEMNMMGIPEAQWEFDHEKKSIVLVIEQI